MYYINALYFFSFLGFCLESFIYKVNKSNRHSGISYGPVTFVYGFGVLALILLKKYLFDRIHGNKFFKLFIVFIGCWITLTFIEWLGGNLLYQVFHIHMWNYTSKSFNCGKYICLELSFVWGVFGTIYVYWLKDFFDQIIALIPKKLTFAILLISFIDTLLVFLNKLP